MTFDSFRRFFSFVSPGGVRRWVAAGVLLGSGVAVLAAPRVIVAPENPSSLVQEALAAEAAAEPERALALFLEARQAQPEDAFLEQKIARQFSDLVAEAPNDSARRRLATEALRHARNASRLAPDDPVARLSVAISAGKLALYGDARTKVECAREIKAEAERAVELDSNYAWAHHVLGRWHLEAAKLGAAKRFVVKLAWGGLPPASAATGLVHLQRAVELDPACAPHHVEYGLALRDAGRLAEARREIEHGLGLPAREKHDAESQRRGRAALAKLGGG